VVSDRSNARPVYSTATGRLCPRCGWPERDCQCSTRRAPGQTVPDRVVAKLRIEKAGRGGKTVTVVYDLPRNETFLKTLAQDLKRACGTGGSVGDGTVELQGDLRDRVRDALRARGFVVKG
jgi:translation initiation factor 1